MLRLKFLFGPLLLIVACTVCILYLKPTFDSYLEERSILNQKQELVDSAQARITHVQDLTKELAEKKDTADFVFQYIPETLDHGSVIDALNYLADQSGVHLNKVTFKENLEKKLAGAISGSDTMDTDSSLSGNASDSVAALVLPKHSPSIKQFDADIEVGGRYENIKDYFDRVAHMNHFHEISSFSIERSSVRSSKTEDDSSKEFLTGTLHTTFSYIMPQKISDASTEGVLLHSQFDGKILEKMMNWVTNTVPKLDQPITNKPDPFE